MAAPTVATDESLADRFKAGDEGAFEALVERHHRSLYHFAYRLLGRAEDAEDATQDALVLVYRALPAARLDVPLRPWIYRILRNRCLDLLKRRRPITFADLSTSAEDDGDGPALVDDQPLPEEMAERADLQRLLAAAIAALAPPYREVVTLRYTSDLQFGEIAAVLGLPENTVKTRFQRAKATLRHALRDLVGGATDDPERRAPITATAGPRNRGATDRHP
jgi:RNA polymerase sigma factor (sigma-70 family)